MDCCYYFLPRAKSAQCAKLRGKLASNGFMVLGIQADAFFFAWGKETSKLRLVQRTWRSRQLCKRGCTRLVPIWGRLRALHPAAELLACSAHTSRVTSTGSPFGKLWQASTAVWPIPAALKSVFKALSEFLSGARLLSGAWCLQNMSFREASPV